MQARHNQTSLALASVQAVTHSRALQAVPTTKQESAWANFIVQRTLIQKVCTYIHTHAYTTQQHNTAEPNSNQRQVTRSMN